MKGNKGVSFNDRQLAGQVRNMALCHLKQVLDDNYEDKEYQKAVLLKLAPALLPRLNEHTGADGAELPVPIFNVHTNSSNQEDNEVKQAN
jgi:hypothetical protein